MKPFGVVVPTTGRRETLVPCLRAITESAGDEVASVVVVFDGAPCREELVATFPGLRMISHSPRGGPSAARNAGAALVEAPHLVFVDDDVCVAPAGFAAMRRVLETHDQPVACVGRIVPDASLPEQIYQVLAYADLVHTPLGEAGEGHWRYCTSFSSVPRDVFVSLGGFSEQFDAPGYEDVELGYRLERAGVATVQVPEAEGRHFKRFDREWFVHQGVADGRKLATLTRLQPGAARASHRQASRHAREHAAVRALHRLGLCFLPVLEQLPRRLALVCLRSLYRLGVAASYMEACRARSRTA